MMNGSRSHLRVVDQETGDEPARTEHGPRPGPRAAAAAIWWWAVVVAASVSGLLYVGICVGVAVRLALQAPPRDPLDVVLTGLCLAFALLVGIGLLQRLRKPPATVYLPGEPVIEQHHHHHYHGHQ